jgi:hypothetical protein
MKGRKITEFTRYQRDHTVVDHSNTRTIDKDLKVLVLDRGSHRDKLRKTDTVL